MNAQRLLQLFNRIAEAPDAVRRLRGFILDLAVRGKLVDQDPNDEPAAKLLKQIQAGKARLVKKGKIKKHELPPQIEGQELPFEPPLGWCWASLAAISRRIHYGFTASANQSIKDVRLLRITDIQNNSVDWSSVPGCEISEREICQYKLEQGDILIARTGGTIGKSFLVKQMPVTAVFASYLIRVQGSPELYDQYLKLFLESPVYWKQLQDGARGGGQPNVNGQTLGRMTVILPPLAEQHRIVAKVDELMALCNRLAAAQAERESRRDRVVAASLHRLNNGAGAQSFREHTRFHLRHLPRLTTRPEHIQQLRKTILNLAVRGKLVPQDPNYEPAPELLKRIHAEKARQLRSGELRKQQSLPEIAKSEAPFEIPDSWCWIRVDDCFNVGGGIQKTPARTPRDNAYPYIGVGNVYRGRLDLTQVKQFELLEGELEKFRLMNDDILVVEGNGSANEIGRCAIWAGQIRDCVHQNHIIRCRPFVTELTPYVIKYLNSPNGVEVMKALSVTSSGLYNLSVGKIRTVVIPLPAVAEQRRIVARVDELMTLCDRLDAQLSTDKTQSRCLLDAVLHNAIPTKNLPGNSLKETR